MTRHASFDRSALVTSLAATKSIIESFALCNYFDSLSRDGGGEAECFALPERADRVWGDGGVVDVGGVPVGHRAGRRVSVRRVIDVHLAVESIKVYRPAEVMY